jgi:opacity protein-like surface antigen
MKSKTLVAVSLCALVGGAAFAQDAEPSTDGPSSLQETPASSEAPAGPKGFEIGLRTGYALGLGSLAGSASGEGTSMSDFTSGMVPIQIDLGYRFNGNWFAGAYFQYGFGFIKESACGASGASCSATDLRFGIEGQYHLMPGMQIDPWVGLGVGYESVNISASEGGLTLSTSVTGLEFVNLSVGGDYRVSPNLGVGPFVGLTVGQYSSAFDTDIQEKAIHMWLSLGVRGAFDVM